MRLIPLFIIVLLVSAGSLTGLAFAQEAPPADDTVIDGGAILAYVVTTIILCIGSAATWLLIRMGNLAGIKTDDAMAQRIRIGIVNSLTRLYEQHGEKIREMAKIKIDNPIAKRVLGDLVQHFPDAVRHVGFEKPQDVQKMVEAYLPRVTAETPPPLP